MYSVLVLSVINDAQFLLFGQYCKQLLYIIRMGTSGCEASKRITTHPKNSMSCITFQVFWSNVIALCDKQSKTCRYSLKILFDRHDHHSIFIVNNSLNVLLNISFCVSKKKEIQYMFQIW